MSKSIYLVLTSAIAIDGNICRKGSMIEVSEVEAKNLLHRGKARLATAEDGVEQDELQDVEVGQTGSVDDDEGNDTDITRMNKTQLTELATQMGIEPGEMTKAQLVEAIEAKHNEAN